MDGELADRVREMLGAGAVREVRMFGGLTFMLDDRIVVSVGNGLLARVDPERDDELLTRPGATRAEMGAGRSMGEGWIAVDAGALDTDEALRSWMDEALAFHRTAATRKKVSTRRTTAARGGPRRSGGGSGPGARPRG